jgi:hypothetical protein
MFTPTKFSKYGHWNLAEFQIFFQFSGHFFAIFAAKGLKVGLLLCNQELLFQFPFWCD